MRWYVAPFEKMRQSCKIWHIDKLPFEPVSAGVDPIPFFCVYCHSGVSVPKNRAQKCTFMMIDSAALQFDIIFGALLVTLGNCS